jgi:hypothetical protein
LCTFFLCGSVPIYDNVVMKFRCDTVGVIWMGNKINKKINKFTKQTKKMIIIIIYFSTKIYELLIKYKLIWLKHVIKNNNNNKLIYIFYYNHNILGESTWWIHQTCSELWGIFYISWYTYLQ